MSDDVAGPRPKKDGYAEFTPIVYIGTLVLAVGLIVVPWVVALIHLPQPFAKSLSVSPGGLLFIDLIGLVPLAYFLRAYRRLSAKIKERDSDVAFLNWVRWSFAGLAFDVVVLLVWVTVLLR